MFDRLYKCWKTLLINQLKDWQKIQLQEFLIWLYVPWSQKSQTSASCSFWNVKICCVSYFILSQMKHIYLVDCCSDKPSNLKINETVIVCSPGLYLLQPHSMLFQLTQKNPGLSLALTPDAIVFKPRFLCLCLCSWMPTLPVAKSPRSPHMSTHTLLFALWIMFSWLTPMCNMRTFFVRSCDDTPMLNHIESSVLWEIMRPDTSISNCTLNVSCSVFCLYIKCDVKRKENWLQGK